MSVVMEKQSPAETFDIVEAKNELVTKYTGSKEVDQLTTEIVLDEPTSIVQFGSSVAEDLSKASDAVLQGMAMEQLNDTGKVLTSLNKIMSQFDIEEITEEPTGIKKLFNNPKKFLEKILSKYDTFGKEVDKIYVQLRQYEDEIKQSNDKLAIMFNSSVDSYNKLEMYILAGEQAVKEIDGIIAQTEAKLTEDSSAQFDLQNYRQAKQLLEGRIQDLRSAEQVAMQSIPMLKSMEFSNFNLVRKINSEFIITLPVFKSAIAQAMLLKRQRIQADATAALDEKANEILKKNAQSTAEASAQIMSLASESSIKIETLQETYNTIMNGIKETQRIQEEASKKREADKVKLEQMKADFNKAYNMQDKRG